MRTARAKLIAGALAVILAAGVLAVSLSSTPAEEPRQPASTAAEAPQRPPLPLTIAIDGGYTSWGDVEVEERAELGAAVTRHEWDPWEPVDEQEDVMEEAAGEIHTRIHALLGGNELGDPYLYRDFVLAFLDRYGLGGSFWEEHPEYDERRFAITSIELGNEPYVGEMSAGEYAATVEPALQAIAALELPVTVVLPSRVYDSDTAWVDRLYARIPDLNDLFDAFAAHPYWYGHSPTEEGAAGGPLGWIETLRQRMDEHGAEGKAIWITEYGQSTALCGEECVTEEAQALHLQQMLDAIRLHPEWRVRMISVFQLRDRGTDSGDRELQFGLLREDGSRKPSYGVVEAAVQASR
ncbi:MAG TPA: glycosyl hydrolase [Solirubrobacterales bacterium]|nr:glycosyl hydrolase [Solirubrobacterales bacterium]